MGITMKRKNINVPDKPVKISIGIMFRPLFQVVVETNSGKCKLRADEPLARFEPEIHLQTPLRKLINRAESHAKGSALSTM